MDVRDDDAVGALVGDAVARFGHVDVLVNNAGGGFWANFMDVTSKGQSALVAENFGQVTSFIRACVPHMHRGGSIVNVTSMAVEFPIPFLSGYNVAKAGLAALTESLMLEAPAAGIAVLDFRPGDYRTGFNQAMFASPDTSLPETARRVAARLDATLAAAPGPARAARDLRRALARGRSGVVRSGSFFQTVVAPLGARLAPLGLRRAVMARYFGIR